MSDCIFCKIINGEMSKFKIYEDEDFLGFLDIRPLNIGNSLLIPKNHYRWVYDVPDFGRYWEVARKISLATMKALEAESISFLTLGYEIPHAHIRIIPRFPNDCHNNSLSMCSFLELDSNQMSQIASKIKYVLDNENY